MARLRLTKAGMPESPNCCTVCGTTPVDTDGTMKPAIFAEGVDIDWGNSLYICWECAELMADLIGRVTREGFDRLTAAFEELQAEHEKLLAEHSEQEELLDTIRKGRDAVKKVKTTA